jgi:flavoprotein
MESGSTDNLVENSVLSSQTLMTSVYVVPHDRQVKQPTHCPMSLLL